MKNVMFLTLLTAVSAIASGPCDGVPRVSNGVTITCTKFGAADALYAVLHVKASSATTEAMAIRVNYINDAGQGVGFAAYTATFPPFSGPLLDPILSYDVVAKLPTGGTDATVQVREYQTVNTATATN